MKNIAAVLFSLILVVGCDDDSSNNTNNTTNNTSNNTTNNISCGNGVVDEGEECDGDISDSCEDEGYYGGTITCSTDCTLNYAECELYGYCGDGEKSEVYGEECDLGDENSSEVDAQCRPDCTLAGCGDGIQDSDEECDLGGENSDEPNALCRVDCQLPRCGDGIHDMGEECDYGSGNGDSPNSCRSDCTLPYCGDGITDYSATYGEECDTGVSGTTDGCTDDCEIELGWSCNVSAVPTVCYEGCGDGTLVGIETNEGRCDDGNNVPGDGCSDYCMIESGWDCDATSGISVCTPHCGDASRVGSETLTGGCDDGNLIGGDGCSPTCFVEVGWTCSDGTGMSMCTPICGDGLITGWETCDDGNTVSGDGCSSTCITE
ncbi:MAG: DUF4215 domain-containing protein [Deltaproteobacteria bacterium]|nr:DUF4215 domain-containing protein [Deltaproteobacteria bacterium]